MGKLLEQGFKKWHEGAADAGARAYKIAAFRDDRNVRQVNPPDVPDDQVTNVYVSDAQPDGYDFTPHLAEGQERVTQDLAAEYLYYRRLCEKQGLTPDEFHDFR